MVILPNLAELERFRQTLPKREQQDTFTFGRYTWDVVLARWLAEQVERPVYQIPLTSFNASYGYDRLVAYYRFHPHLLDPETKPTFLEMRALPFVLIGVEMQTVLSDGIDLARPIILGLGQKNGGKVGSFILDGHYRVVRALWEGLESVPGVVLSVEETAACER